MTYVLFVCELSVGLIYSILMLKKVEKRKIVSLNFFFIWLKCFMQQTSLQKFDSFSFKMALYAGTGYSVKNYQF